MSKAIGMVEYKTVSAGVIAADAMVKTADISIIEAQTVCPGKYIVIITGDLSAVDAAVNRARAQHEEQLISSFILGNPHESIFPAIYGAAQIEEVSALGILETYDAATMIVAADEAAKTDRAPAGKRNVRKVLYVFVRGNRCRGGGHHPRKTHSGKGRYVPRFFGDRSS